MTTSHDPDEIRRDIERTRAELSGDVDALAEKVNPKRAAERQADKVRGAVTGAKERVFGAAEDAKEAASERLGSTGDRAGSAAHDAPAQLRSKATGNPVAAGLVAFGLGLLAASAIPASRTERDLVEKGKQSDALQSATQGAKQAAQDVAEHLREPAQDAVQEVKATATEGAQDVKEKASQGAAEVKDAASSEAESVKQEAEDTKEGVQRSAGSPQPGSPRPGGGDATGTTPRSPTGYRSPGI